jgi:tryptophan synthase beta chain
MDLASMEGILPEMEPAHAIAWLLSAGSSAAAPDPADGFDLLCLSGRGDKDLAEAVARLQELDG